MRLLFLGGTIFVGRHLVDAALARGHTVTLFHRGKHPTHRPDDLEEIHGDRDGDLQRLAGRRWDAAIDTSGYVPRVVEASASLLAAAVARYLFVSTLSVYADLSEPGRIEDAPLEEVPTTEEVTAETYGGLKVGCERAVQRIFGEKALVIRPGLIVGPHDQSDRFTYWVTRVATGGEVLAAAPAERAVQVIDARDLAAWAVRMIEADGAGVFNAVGPAEPLPMARLLGECRSVSGSDAHITWVDPAFLLDEGVTPWTELPLWAPPEDEFDGLGRTSNARAVRAGLTFRPLAATIADVLAWHSSRGPVPLEAGLSREREQELLRRWHARS